MLNLLLKFQSFKFKMLKLNNIPEVQIKYARVKLHFRVSNSKFQGRPSSAKFDFT